MSVMKMGRVMEILPVLFFLLGTLHGIRAPDCDHDGVPDDEDVDDDNDGIVDEGEPCGDSDGDGVLDMDDPDYNEAQFEDYDGEGVWALDSYNFDEGAVSAGCEDYGDCDEDGDGSDDQEHIEEDSGKGQGDYDQDGIPDFLDSDDDDDGVPDKMDNDDDNDGIIDEEDPDHNDRVPALTAGPQNVELTSACDYNNCDDCDDNCWIRVDWTPPPRDAWMSCLLGYRVGIRPWRVGARNRWTTDWIWTDDRGTHHDLRLNKFFFYEEPEGTNHSLTMRDLDHTTTYEVKILTFNPEGGVHEESHEVNTPSG